MTHSQEACLVKALASPEGAVWGTEAYLQSMKSYSSLAGTGVKPWEGTELTLKSFMLLAQSASGNLTAP